MRLCAPSCMGGLHGTVGHSDTLSLQSHEEESFCFVRKKARAAKVHEIAKELPLHLSPLGDELAGIHVWREVNALADALSRIGNHTVVPCRIASSCAQGNVALLGTIRLDLFGNSGGRNVSAGGEERQPASRCNTSGKSPRTRGFTASCVQQQCWRYGQVMTTTQEWDHQQPRRAWPRSFQPQVGREQSRSSRKSPSFLRQVGGPSRVS